VKALTVKQPWASLIASGIKQVENRTYPVPKTVRGERVAIHAGKGFDKYWDDSDCCVCMSYHWDGSPVGGGECDYCKSVEWGQGHEYHAKQVAGRILCTARIIGQFEPFDDTPEHFETGKNAPCRVCGGDGNRPGFCDFQKEPFYYGSEEEEREAEWWCLRCHGSGWDFDFVDWGFRERNAYGWILADVELVNSDKIHKGMLGFWTVKGDL
jgi:hypothetical protein